MQQIPPPPPGFVIQGGGAAPPPQPRSQTRQATTPRFTGPLPQRAEDLFPSLIQQESGGRAGVVGPNTRWGNAIGRTQMLPATAREVSQRLNLPYREDLLRGTSPEAIQYQDRLGLAYLQEGFERTGNARDALMYYHGGPDRRLWGPKTNAYADNVLALTARGEGVQPQLGDAQFTSTPMGATPPPPPEGFVIEGADTLAPVANEQNVERAGMRTIGGKTQLWDAATQSYVDATPEQVAEYQANLRRDQQDRIARAERMADPQYQLAMSDARRGSENVPDALRAVSLGQTLGFTDEINALAQGGIQAIENAGNRLAGQPVRYSAEYAAQAARDAERDAAARYAAENPLTNFGLQLAGGLVTPGIMGAGQYINAAQGSARLGRAGQVGAGYGAASGFGNATGGIGERAPEAALGAAVGAGVGAIGQRTVDRLMAPQAARPASAARRLSREGVQLTPGQMLSETPVIGPVARTLEEAASTIPFVGGAVASARERSIDTFNRAALNRVLEPLGETMPTGLRSQIARIGRGEENPQSGFEAVGRVQDIVSRRYDRALEGIEVRPDQQFYDDLAQVAVNVAEEVPEPMVAQYTNILQNRVFRTLEERDSILTGQNFKRAESELGMLAREQRMSLDPANKALARALDDSRTVLRDLIARQRPDRAPEIQAVNRAYSNLVPIEEAAGAAASEAREGVFTPTTLSQNARRNQTRSTRAAGEGRMQDLTAAGRAVLNSRIGDSGTASRGAVTALASGAAGAGSVMNPAVAVPTIIGVSLAYSRPAQALLNAAYQAADSQTANLALQELAVLAQRNPALVPYYQDAVSFVRGLALPDTQAAPPARSSTQAPSAALQRVMQ